MRHNYISRAICWLMSMVLAMLPTLAQGSRQVITASDGKSFCVSSCQPDITWVQQNNCWKTQPSQTPKKVEPTEETVTVTFECNLGDIENVYVRNFEILDNNGKTITMYENSRTLSPGIYDILANITSYFDPLYFHVIHENVTISKDTTIIFNITEACNQIHITDHHPNGEIFTFNETYAYSAIESGLNRKCDGGNFITIDGDMYNTNMPDIFINDVSNRFLYYQANAYVTDETCGPNPEAYITFFTSDDLTTPIENNADNYRYIKERFTPSRISIEETEYKGIGGGLSIFFNENKLAEVGLGMFTNDPSICDVNLYVNIPETNKNQNGLYILPRAMITDYVENDYLPWGVAHTPRSITSPLFSVNDNNEVNYMNLGIVYYESIWLFNGNETKYPYFRGPHPFYYTSAQKKQDFGSGTPIFVYTKTQFDVGGVMIGRYGENRQVDNETTTNLTLKKNGEEVWTGQMLDLWNGQIDIYNQEPLGIIEGVYNNKNVIVDGLLGQNLTTIHYDESIEGDIAPTLTMLWFKGTNGDATDRFENAEDGLLEFSAGDFVPHLVTYYTWYSCQALSEVEVSYSPYLQDSWNELEVEEIPENFCSPGYGYFYRGSLAGVTGLAEKGWFDLKIRLTDAAGNWQEQVISPAFRIDDLAYTSVANVGSDNASEVARYSIDGKRVDASHHGVTIIKMSDGTAKKMIVQ